jgi:cytochrome c552
MALSRESRTGDRHVRDTVRSGRKRYTRFSLVSSRFRSSIALVLLVALFAVACAGAAPAPTSHATPARVPARTASDTRENVLFSDYVGSTRCKECHADIYASWTASPMHRMTRTPPGAEVQAPFDGTALHFKDDTVTLERRGEDRLVRIESPTLPAPKVYRVTRVIGGREREDFAGVEVPGGREELVLPVSFLLYSKALRYKGYSVMTRERDRARAGPVWNRTCIFCHNTAPYWSTLLGVFAGRGAGAYQGVTVDRLLPRSSAWRFDVTDDAALRRAASDEVTRLDGQKTDAAWTTEQVLSQAVGVTRASFGAGDLVEVGIGCEACHGGGREHAERPEVLPTFEPRSPFFQLASRPTRAELVTRACARCHQVLFSQYPYTWEGGKRAERPGGSHISSGEARDMLLGGCAREMTCTSCHEVHAPDGGRARLREVDSPAGNAVCTACHPAYKEDAALAAHSHHAASGPRAVSCIDCHMPRKNMSLDARLTRYHRIGSPTDPLRVLGDRPLECALCHADKSLGALVGAMETWWKKAYDREVLARLYGSLDANVMLATLANGKPHERAVATSILGAKRERRAATLFARELVDGYPLLRDYARAALEATFGERLGIDLDRDDDAIERDARAWLSARGVDPGNGPWTTPPAAAAQSGESGED